MDRITRKQVDIMQDRLNKHYGFNKFIACGRYNYIGIDEYSKSGGCENTLISGLTKREACNIFWVMSKAIEAIKELEGGI